MISESEKIIGTWKFERLSLDVVLFLELVPHDR